MLRDRHPGDHLLLLALDLQLSNRRQARVVAHVAGCTECQARTAHLRSTVLESHTAESGTTSKLRETWSIWSVKCCGATRVSNGSSPGSATLWYMSTTVRAADALTPRPSACACTARRRDRRQERW